MKQEQDSSKKRDWRLLGLAGGIFVLAACVFGGFYSQRRAAQTMPSRQQPQPRMIADISPEVKAQFVGHAKMLREKWEPWAQKHQAQFQRMLNASVDDQAALATAWDAVPSDPKKVGFTSQELMPTGDPLTGVGFGWTALDKELRQGSPRPEAAAGLQKISLMVMPQRRSEFKRRRDIIIAQGGMRTETLLWASGRITQRSLLLPGEYLAMARAARDKKRKLTGDDMWGPEQEMVPPYDFLISSQIS